MAVHKCTKDKVIDNIIKNQEKAQTAQIESDKKDVLQSEQILRMQSDITEIKLLVKEIKDNMEKNYAAKWVERVIKGMIALILGAVFTAILANVIIKQ